MKSRQTDNYFPAKTPRRETLKMLMLLSCKFCCLSYMTILAAILDAVVQNLHEVSVFYDHRKNVEQILREYGSVMPP